MRISKIHIQNFRKLKNCTLDFGEKQTILVGANNSGKTSCMQAIVRFLKDSKSLSTRDFTLSSIPQLFQKIACWTQNCYYDVLGLYLNAVFLVTSHFFPLPHNAT